MHAIHDTTYLLLTIFATLVVVVALLYQAGALGWLVQRVGQFLFDCVETGFFAWRRLLAWAPWPVFVVIVAVLHVPAFLADVPRFVTGLCGLALLAVGVLACLAYVYVDLERYDVGRGYKVLAGPAKGQELAVHLGAYGDRLNFFVLAAATLATISGFALLNQGLYETVGASWYALGSKSGTETAPASEEAGRPDPQYADFLAYTLINLSRLVDLLDIANSYNYAHLTYVRQARWPASTLLVLFKAFFSFVLLQQLFSAVRNFKLLGDTIKDFWSPHAPIHQRAAGTLGQYGAAAVPPLLQSLRSVEVLTPEQRTELPRLIADLGPTAIPILVKHLRDPDEKVRATVVSALGHLQALESLRFLEHATRDPSEWVRQALVEALQGFCGSGTRVLHKTWSLRVALLRSRTWALWWWRWRQRRDRRPDYVTASTAMLRVLVRDESAQVRAKAVQALALLGPAAKEAVPELTALLADPDESVRCEAMAAVARIGVPAAPALAALRTLLTDGSATVRAGAARALAVFKTEAWAAAADLVPLLQDREEAVRQAAAETLAVIGPASPATTDQLTAGLTSDDNVVRARAAEALGTIGSTAPTTAAATAPALVDALADANDQVRAKAAEALGKIGAPAADADAVPSLVARLSDPDNQVAALAAQALAEMGPCAASAVPALLAALRHVNPDVRGNAVGALGEIRTLTREILPALRQAVGDEDSHVRARALAALARLDVDRQEVETSLLLGLKDGDPEVRISAVQALVTAGHAAKAVLDALRERLEDVSDDVRVEVLKALPALTDDPSFVEAICRLLRDDTPAVQARAAQALAKLGQVARSAGEALFRAFQTADAALREEVLRALVQVQPPEGVSAFLAGLQDPSADVRILAAAGLLKTDTLPAEAEPLLVDALKDPEARVRSTAAQIFVRQGVVPQAALPYLLDCTGHTDDGVRLNAARALKLAPSVELDAVMERLLADDKMAIRLLAAQHLLAADPKHIQALEAFADTLGDASSRLREAALTELMSLGHSAIEVLATLRSHHRLEEQEELRALIDGLVDRLEVDAEANAPADAAARR